MSLQYLQALAAPGIPYAQRMVEAGRYGPPAIRRQHNGRDAIAVAIQGLLRRATLEVPPARASLVAAARRVVIDHRGWNRSVHQHRYQADRQLVGCAAGNVPNR